MDPILGKKTSDLDPVDSLDGTEWFALVKNGVDMRARTDQMPYSGDQPAQDSKSVSVLSISSGNVSIDLASGSNKLFSLTLTENVTSWTFSNRPGSGSGGSIMVQVTQGASTRTMALPSGSIHTGGELPSGIGEKAVLAMTSFDNWSTLWTTIGTPQ